ncbi:MAG TPA: DUF4340 domain-containing protein, partial [Myxococcales bacterium]|nr:DUF4340 domain-containing protein [Myxococcales bacterium]
MRVGAVEIHALLLVTALGLAYHSWTADDAPPPAQEELAIWDLGATPIDSMQYLAGKRTLTIERKSDEQGSYLWGVSVREQNKGNTVTREFRVNEKGKESFEKLKKPMAKRSLGQLSEADLKEMKLAEPEATIELKAGAETKRLFVGMGAYGGGLKYVREAQSGTVYVLEAKALDDLRWGDSRMVERELLGFKLNQVARVDLTADKKQRSWNTADTKHESATTWLGKLFRLRVVQYVGKNENIHAVDGKTVESTSVMQVILSTQDGQSNTLKLIRVGDGKR